MTSSKKTVKISEQQLSQVSQPGFSAALTPGMATSREPTGDDTDAGLSGRFPQTPQKQLAPASVAPARLQAASGCWQLHACPTCCLQRSQEGDRRVGGEFGEGSRQRSSRIELGRPETC